MTQEHIAQQIGVSDATVSSWERQGSTSDSKSGERCATDRRPVPRPRRRKHTEDEEAAAFRRVLSGEQRRDVARDLGTILPAAPGASGHPPPPFNPLPSARGGQPARAVPRRTKGVGMMDERWMARVGERGGPGRWYRVEHWGPDGVHCLGRLPDVTPHPATLAPFASRLVREQATGELVLIDEATGIAVARQDLRTGPRRGPTRGLSGRPPGPRRGDRI
jgi:hypothetical protein